MGLSLVYVPSMALPVLAVMLVFMFSSACIADAYASRPTSSLLSSSRRFSACKIRHSPAAFNKASARGIHTRREDGSPVTLYLFPTPPSMLAANYPHKHQHHSRCRSRGRPNTSIPMSDSVLAESDILPSFKTAHGLLSPEIVTRIADTNDLELGGPLHTFLKTYKSNGPMACLPMLSDPCILPELTRAMREIA